MKIRGTPAHIAEKYLTLARDAQSSGDPVLGENYLQHAEHYNRIIMAYREQLQQPGELPNGNGQRLREPGDVGDDFGEEEGEDLLDESFQPPHPPMPQHHQPPRHQGGFEGGRHDRPFRRDQGGFRHRDRDRERDRDRDRDHRGDRDRPAEGRPVPHERHPEPMDVAPEARRDGGGEPRRRDRFQQPHEQPDFLRRPVRRVRPETEEATPPPSKDEPSRD